MTQTTGQPGPAARADTYSIGVDTGGTHTDLVLAGGGRLVTLKVPSTRDDLSVGIVEGVMKIVQMAGVPVAAVERFVYGSTFVTNLFVEERQAGVGLITTEGFRDVLEIGRASRKPDVYDIHWRPARPLVPRHLRLGVRERMDHRGEVLLPLDEDAAREALCRLARAGVGSIAVCLLHAYANPAHERRIAELAAQECPGIGISLSSDVVREFREYERSSTTCVDAFIKQPITRHLQGLAQALADNGVRAAPCIMRGNGGISKFDTAAGSPTAVTHSGVMGGIVGATALAAACGIRDIITLDMGGTSADVSLIADGAPVLSSRSHIGPHPLLVPTLDMVTIGAGGGSIAWVDGATALRVGPRSAGSMPGPACYGLGGEQPTVTDANLLAGRLNGDYFLGGARRLQSELALQAVDGKIAQPLGMSLEHAALGIIAIAEAHMANAIRLVTVERGLDPRDFTLVAFGGAGALHAASLAQALSIRKVLIPPAPGNMSAMGLLCADVRHDLTRTVVGRVEAAAAPRLAALFDELLEQAQAALDADGVAPSARRCLLSADLRYQGQNYELTLPVSGDDLSADIDGWRQRFHERHSQVYGYRLDGRDIQTVNLRVTAMGAAGHARWPEIPGSAAAQPAGRRSVLMQDGTRVQAPVYRHDTLRAGQELAGPAVVEYAGGTLFLPPEWRGRLDSMTNLHLVHADPVAAPAGSANRDKEFA